VAAPRLSAAAPAVDRAADRRQTARIFIDCKPDFFRSDFNAYLDKNFHVFEAFSWEADKIWARGRRHYSGRTIIEALRHESNLCETLYSDLKINDWYTPDLCRLYLSFNPDRVGFFELRTSQSSVRGE